MPPAQDDDRNTRQIEALRRYVAELGTDRERPESETSHRFDDEDQPPRRGMPPSVPWLVLTAVLVAAALVGGVIIGAARDNGQQPSAQQQAQATTTLGAPVASPECMTAVEQANLGLTAAVKVRGVLGEYTKVMNDLRNGRIDSRQAAAQISPYLTLATDEGGKFDRALADYRDVVAKCTLREP
jgi:hypothetical protein